MKTKMTLKIVPKTGLNGWQTRARKALTGYAKRHPGAVFSLEASGVAERVPTPYCVSRRAWGAIAVALREDGVLRLAGVTRSRCGYVSLWRSTARK